MRIPFEFQDEELWVDFQDHFSRIDMRRWVDAQNVRELTPEEDEAVEKIIEAMDADVTFTERDRQVLWTERRMLDLLQGWCDDCRLKDSKGNVYHKMADLTVPIMERLDWAVYNFLVGLGSTARSRNAQLGKVIDEQS